MNKSSGELVVNNNFHVFTNNLIIGSDQKICFEDTAARLVLKVQEGYFCCLMVYGQTGKLSTHQLQMNFKCIIFYLLNK